MSEDYFSMGERDAKILAKKISREDYEALKVHWKNRNYTLLAFMLRRYGLDFKGLTYLETLVNELIKIKEGQIKAT
ncbi:hypothetical protein KEJ18_06865 [Candidatus Bathyarchaeota archaeon]|nr:hypothetical protein [Candidatus Bathyarchaeota archaeon]